MSDIGAQRHKRLSHRGSQNCSREGSTSDSSLDAPAPQELTKEKEPIVLQSIFNSKKKKSEVIPNFRLLKGLVTGVIGLLVALILSNDSLYQTVFIITKCASAIGTCKYLILVIKQI